MRGLILKKEQFSDEECAVCYVGSYTTNCIIIRYFDNFRDMEIFLNESGLRLTPTVLYEDDVLDTFMMLENSDKMFIYLPVGKFLSQGYIVKDGTNRYKL